MPENLALVDLSGLQPASYRYGDLLAMANGVGAALRARGHTAGARVGLLCSNSARFYAGYFGALYAGCTVVPCNPRAGADAIAHVCRDADLKLMIADGEPPSGIPAELEVVHTDSPEFETWIRCAPIGTPDPPGATPALILYTSGSTGRPKGVMLSHTSQVKLVEGLAQPAVRSILSRGPCIVAAPLFHMNGLAFSQLAFSCGAQVILMRRFEAHAFVRALDRYRVAVLSGVPTMVALLAQERQALAGADLSCVKLVLIGSAPLSDTVLAQVRELFPQAAVINSYGTTEIGAGLFGPHPAGVPRPPLSIGYPALHAEVRLVGGPSADEGVLEARSLVGMTGYLNLPQVTAQKMRDGWVNTGDLMRRDAAGFFYFIGRADDMFCCSGENVYPGEVERLLERQPAILEASVVPVPDAIRGEVPVVFVVVRPGAALSEREVKDYVLKNASPHLHPRRVWFLDQMPLSGVNKIDRQALKQRARELVAQQPL